MNPKNDDTVEYAEASWFSVHIARLLESVDIGPDILPKVDIKTSIILSRDQHYI